MEIKDILNLIGGIITIGFGWFGLTYVDKIILGVSDGTLTWAFGFVYAVIIFALLLLGILVSVDSIVNLIFNFTKERKTPRDNKARSKK